jgi:hypothetical protein
MQMPVRTQNPHLTDSRQHPTQDRACCTHTAGYDPRFPDSRPIGTPVPVPGPRFPFPGRIGERGISRFPFPAAESGIGNSLPVSKSRPNRESGEREFGVSRAGSESAGFDRDWHVRICQCIPAT